jgi:hypothetical protein
MRARKDGSQAFEHEQAQPRASATSDSEAKAPSSSSAASSSASTLPKRTCSRSTLLPRSEMISTPAESDSR